MPSSYTNLNKKLRRQINALKSAINSKLNLLESGGGIGLGDGGLDPTYNALAAASGQNKGYISGVQGGNSDAVIANPSKIVKTSAELSSIKLGAFGFDQTPQKPIMANNIGLGMGFGLGDQEFEATKNFVNQYSKNFKFDTTNQQLDPQELGYLSWKSVNDAVANKSMQDLTKTLETWGLYSPTDNGMIPPALPDEYSVMDPSKAFAKKFKNIEDIIAGKQENNKSKSKGKTIGKIVNSVKNK